MKKFLIIVLAVAFIGLIAFWAFVTFGPKPVTVTTNPIGGTTTLPSSGTVSVSTYGNPAQATSTTIAGSGGIVISTNDFLHAPNVGAYPAAGYYYLGYHVPLQGISDPTATDNPPYIIEYIKTTQYFNISLLQEPIGQVREEVQQYLMTILGISQSQMCQLNYMVSVPNSINSQFAGRNLGFSFCPGATPLPK